MADAGRGRPVRDRFRGGTEDESRDDEALADGHLRGLRPAELRLLEVGAAYAVWTGIGAAGTAVIGMAFLGDTVSTMKLVSISLILAGVVGLNLSGVTP